jgi:hypothetical protein
MNVFIATLLFGVTLRGTVLVCAKALGTLEDRGYKLPESLSVAIFVASAGLGIFMGIALVKGLGLITLR